MIEIERKFLVKELPTNITFDSVWSLTQGYLSSNPNQTVRIRLQEGAKGSRTGFLTVKGQQSGLTRVEIETPIDPIMANTLLTLFCSSVISKTRHNLIVGDLCWEIDVFNGDLEGLIIAEIELSSEDEKIVIPDWVGREVSMDHNYANSTLVNKRFVNGKLEDKHAENC